MEMDHPVEGRVKSIGFPVKLSETKQRVRRHPPLLGEHNTEILTELGLDEAGDGRAARRRSDPMSGQVDYAVKDGIAFVTFNRPEARNAMTWAMYDGLARACDAIVSDDTVRVALLRGAGGSFVAGTDIQQFTAFEGGKDGLAYEKRIETEHRSDRARGKADGRGDRRLRHGRRADHRCVLRFPAGDAGCAVRRADRAHARQLHLGRQCRAAARAFRNGAGEAHADAGRDGRRARRRAACGFVEAIHPPEEISAKAEAMCKRLIGHAPITMRAAKEAMRRRHDGQRSPTARI